jgi:hypothetical protein
MLTPRQNLTRRLTAALDASPSRIPVLIGGCGTGRTTIVQQLRERAGHRPTLSLNVERTATTPERFRNVLAAASPFQVPEPAAAGARAAFDATLDFFSRGRTPAGESITFLLDEFLELRTFESFPGLRRVLHELVEALGQSSNRFVLTSRYVARTLRLLRDRSARFEVIHMPSLTVEDTIDIVGVANADAANAAYTARTVHALGDGRPAYVCALVEELASMRAHRGGDPMGALTALLVPDGRLSTLCRFCYELRLHRARGYGALKAILDILGEDEGLTLTEIAQRLRRTPGSTKDYLSWLEDVDLVIAQQKRYSFADPLLRVWVRLHCRASNPSEFELAREVHRYARPRLPAQEPALMMASSGSGGSGIIEID